MGMMCIRFLTLFLLSLTLVCPPVLAKSGLPVPRFVSLRSPHINVRVGPGKDYPIEWVYMRANLPVEIIAEFENWRKIKDVEGSEGWVHQSMLTGTRHALVQKTAQDIKDQPRIDSKTVAQIEPEVMVRLLKCQGEWCRVQIESIRGWLPKTALWGVYPGEIVN
jgi:SH3-like domain-containing protein